MHGGTIPRGSLLGCAALELVEEQLPVVPNLALAHAAQTLLEACAAAGALEWSIALGLALENSLLLAGPPHTPAARHEDLDRISLVACGGGVCAACRCLERRWLAEHANGAASKGSIACSSPNVLFFLRRDPGPVFRPLAGVLGAGAQQPAAEPLLGRPSCAGSGAADAQRGRTAHAAGEAAAGCVCAQRQLLPAARLQPMRQGGSQHWRMRLGMQGGALTGMP